jgi:hypothetical protein
MRLIAAQIEWNMFRKLVFFCALYVAFVWLLCFKTAMKPVMYSFFIHDGESDEKVKYLKIAWCHYKFVWSYKLIMTQRILAKKHFLLNNHLHDEIGSLALSESERRIFRSDTTPTQDFSHSCRMNVWFITIHDPDIILGTSWQDYYRLILHTISWSTYMNDGLHIIKHNVWNDVEWNKLIELYTASCMRLEGDRWRLYTSVCQE